MSILRSLFERVLDNVRMRVSRIELPRELPRTPQELLALAQGAVRTLLMPPSVGGAPAEIEPTRRSAPSERAPGAPPATHRATIHATETAPSSGASEASEKGEPSPPAEAHAPATVASALPLDAAAHALLRSIALTPEAPHPTDAAEPSPAARVEASKFALGPFGQEGVAPADDLDARIDELPFAYGDARLFLLPRSPEWLLALWDFTNEQKEAARRQGGRDLGLRIYDVSDHGRPASLAIEVRCDELANSHYVPVKGDRTYAAELGYWAPNGAWLALGRSPDASTPRAHALPGPIVFATVAYERAAKGGVERWSLRPNVRTSLTAEVALALAAARAALHADAAHAPGKRAPDESAASEPFTPGSLPTSPAA